MFSVKWWEDRLYPTDASRENRVAFVNLLKEHIRPESRVLDIGAGAGLLNPYDFKGHCKEMTGVDYDPRVADNPLLDRGIAYSGDRLPVDDGCCDVAFSIYVLEHVEKPEVFIGEIRRVLKPGGIFLAMTPNRRHYVAWISACTPHGFHKWFNKKRGRESDDTFPTWYRMNTRRRLRKQFLAAGFEPVVLDTIEGRPNYLRFSLPTFLVGALYERIVSCSRLFAPFRVNVFCGFRKQ